jgi:hypothetical protein
VFNQVWIAKVLEAGRKLLHDPSSQFHLPQQQRAGIGRQAATVKPAHDFAVLKGLKFKSLLATLCHDKAARAFQFS